MAKQNTLADSAVSIALKQLQASWEFKLPRVRAIQKYRRLYNTQVLPKLRQQFNVPLPVFSGMIDTLQADLDDRLLIEYQNTDPADWKAVEKANAALKQESESARPGAMWEKKFRQYRFEKIMTGRGIAKFTAGNDKGYYSNLEVVPFEDFFFEPLGGGNLENHLFCGQQNIWRTKGQLEDGVEEGIYDKGQVEKLLKIEGKDYKMSGVWDSQFDVGNRFRPLGLNPESHNYVGEESFNLCEWALTYQGKRWYILFEAFTGTWIRFDKLSAINSADQYPFISSASHEDLKNFASKSVSDDLYPVADSIITLFNQDLTNRQKRLLNARAYDRQMFKDVGKLDEAQYRPDALVPVDTKNGTRRIQDGIYEFKTPEISGTVDLIDWLQRDAGKDVGITDTQMGAPQQKRMPASVVMSQMAQITKRLSFTSKPFKEMGSQLGERFFVSLKDYMKEPMSIKKLGELGVEWDVLRRMDLDTEKSFEITVSSETQKDNANDTETANHMKAFQLTTGSPNVNARVRDEFIFRKIGKLPEHEIALLLDVNADADKETQAEVSAAIQDILIRGKKPKTNYNADLYFIKRLLDFAKQHQDTLPDKKFKMLMEYAQEHQAIVQKNMPQLVKKAASRIGQQGAPADDAAPVPPKPMPALPQPANNAAV